MPWLYESGHGKDIPRRMGIVVLVRSLAGDQFTGVNEVSHAG